MFFLENSDMQRLPFLRATILLHPPFFKLKHDKQETMDAMDAAQAGAMEPLENVKEQIDGYAGPTFRGAPPDKVGGWGTDAEKDKITSIPPALTTTPTTRVGQSSRSINHSNKLSAREKQIRKRNATLHLWPVACSSVAFCNFYSALNGKAIFKLMKTDEV